MVKTTRVAERWAGQGLSLGVLSDLVKSWLTPPMWVGSTLWVSKGEKIRMEVVVVVGGGGWGSGEESDLSEPGLGSHQDPVTASLCACFPLGKRYGTLLKFWGLNELHLASA